MSDRSAYIKQKIHSLPESPGVYQYFDKNGTIIYVGKAKNLKRRVNSYFTKHQDTAKTRILVRHIYDIKFIVVATETDALLLENSLIKKYKPKYNIQLKDDKTYPWICIKNERFPRVFLTRKVINDGSKYYGPYPSVYVVNTLLDLIKELYPLRTCNFDLSEENIKKGKYKACLEYQIGNCKAPCIGLETEGNYNTYISQIENIIKGNTASVVRLLKAKMNELADKWEFEAAQNYKKQIEALEKFEAKSTVVSPTVHQVDVITLERAERRIFVNYLVINKGAIVHGLTVEIKNKLEENNEDVLAFALVEMRERFNSQSKEILVENSDGLNIEGLSFFAPKRGDKKHLLDLSKRNTKYFRLQKQKQEALNHPKERVNKILSQMQKDFGLKELPVHIECFDNSNILGTYPVSACVVFKNAKASKKDYRHFIPKTVEGPDDFETMREVVHRRYKRMMDEGSPLPQLLVIDGGKGQVSAAYEALCNLGIEKQLPMIGIAKRLEEIFFPNDPIPLYLDRRSESLKVIQQMRDEAHRFGITHHRNRRSKGFLVSELTEIKGIGAKTQEELIQHFKTVNNVKNASKKDLEKIIGLSKTKIILKYFSNRDSTPTSK